MNIFFHYAKKSLKENKKRTLVTILGIILSTSMLTAVTVFFTSVQSYLLEGTKKYEGDWHVSAAQISKEEVQKLQNREEVQKAAVTELMGCAKIEGADDYNSILWVEGFPEGQEDLLPVRLISGRMPKTANELILSKNALQSIEIFQKVGLQDTITLTLGKQMFEGEEVYNGFSSSEVEWFPVEEKTFTIVGFYEASSLTYRTLGLMGITGMEQKEEHKYQIYLNLKEPKDKVFGFVESILTEGGEIQYHNEYLRYLGIVDNDRFYDVITGLIGILICLIMGGSILLIYNAFSISVNERKKQFGLLASIGATKKQIGSTIWYEAMVVSAIGIPIGVLSGILGISGVLFFVQKGISSLLKTLIYSNIDGSPVSLVFSWPILLLTIFAALLTVIFSAWVPYRRLKKESVMESLRQSKDIFIHKREVKSFQIWYRLFGFEGMLASKNFKRNKRKYRTTVISLSLSMALFISTYSFTSYIQQSTSLVFEDSEFDLGYQIQNKEKGEEILNVLKQDTSYESLLCVDRYFTSINLNREELNNQTATLLEAEVSEKGEVNLEAVFFVLEDSYFWELAKKNGMDVNALFNGDRVTALLLEEQMLFNQKTDRYERMSVLKEKKSREFQIEGVSMGVNTYLTKSPVGETFLWSTSLAFFIPQSQFDTFLKEKNLDGDRIVLFTSKDHETTENNLTRLLFENRIFYNDGILSNMAREYEGDRNTLIAIQVLSGGFIALISMIALANVFHTISTNLILRKREFAMLYSTGLSPKGRKRMMNYECVLYGLKAVLFGIPLSVLFTAAIYFVILRGVDIYFVLPFEAMGLSILCVFAVVFATMLYTMRKLGKENILDVLKEDH